MSWTDVYPVFTEELLDEYHESATLPEKVQLEEWYGLERIINFTFEGRKRDHSPCHHPGIPKLSPP